MIALAALTLLSTPCPAAVDARGPDAADLQQALARRAVAPPTEGCPGIAVHIERRDAGFDLRREGARAQRVPTLETAALLVETWVRADLIDPLLAARAGPPQPTPPAAAVTIAPAVPPPRDLHLDFGLQAGAADDKSFWTGVYGQGCLKLGAVCVGVRGQVRVDPSVSGASKDARVWRLGLGVLATGDMELGPIRAGVGVGVSSVLIDRIGRPEDDIRGAPLLQARVDHPVQLTDAWALTLGVNAELAFWPRRHGRTDTREDDFPESPHGTVLASVGLRWGGR